MKGKKIFFSIIIFALMQICFQSPVLGANFEVASTTSAETNPAVAYNSTDDEYLVVYKDNTTYIKARIIKSDGTMILISISSGSGSVSNPGVAYNSTDNEYFIVWQRYTSISGHYSHNIYARRVSATGALSSEIEVAKTYFDDTNPDVAYNSSNNEYLVVWQYEGSTQIDIHGRIYYADGNLRTFLVPASESYIESSPSVTYDSTNNNYLVLWHGDPPDINDPPLYIPTYSTVFGRLITNSGTVGSQFSSGLGSPRLNAKAAWRPITGTTGEYLIVWEEVNGTESSIQGQIVNGSLEKEGRNSFKISEEGSEFSSSLVFSTPDVAYNSFSNEYLTAYVYVYSPTNFDIYCRQVSPNGTLPGSELMISALGSNESLPALASGAFSSHLMVWQDDSGPDIYGSFTGRPVADPPTALNIGAYDATLSGVVLANDPNTTWYFEYGTTLSYGGKTISQPIDGADLQNISYYISGLLPNADYHIRTVIQNNMGQWESTDRTFHTLDADPYIATTNETNVGSTTVTLNGVINPRGTETTYSFEYGPDTNYGFWSPTPPASAGSSRALVGVSRNLTGLLPNQTYHYRLVGFRGSTQYPGGDEEFTTNPIPPFVTTTAPSNITPYQVQFNGEVNPRNAPTWYYFRYGPDTGSLSTTNPYKYAGRGYVNVPADDLLSGLLPGTSGVYQLVAYNTAGTNYGDFQNYSTPPVAPAVTTVGSSLETAHSARVHGRINAMGGATTWRFWYRVSGAGFFTGTNPPGQIAPGNHVVNVYADLSNLVIDKQYEFYLKATNSAGSNSGAVLTFNTPAVPPEINLLPADQITADSAVLKAEINPKETETSYYFIYWIDGETAKLTSTKNAGSGNQVVIVSEEITGLIPDQTYKVQFVAENTAGQRTDPVVPLLPVPDHFTTKPEYFVSNGIWPNARRPWYFNKPRSIATDNDGNVYVADTQNHRIQKFTSNGHLINVWGEEGSGIPVSEDDPVQFNQPLGVAVDSKGDVYVADSLNYRIQKFNARGDYITHWNCVVPFYMGYKPKPFNLTIAEFDLDPREDPGSKSEKIYVCFGGSGNINHNGLIQIYKKTESAGSFVYPYILDEDVGDGSGQFGDGYGTEYGQFDFTWNSGNPEGDIDHILYWLPFPDISGGYHWQQTFILYVADYGNNRVQIFDGNDTVLTGAPGEPFAGPNGIAVSRTGSHIYVLDSGNKNIKEFNSSYGFVSKFPDLPDDDAKIVAPKGINLDKSGSVYLADTEGYAVQKFNREGELVSKWALNSDLPGYFDHPEAMCVDSTGNIYVADTANDRIQKFNSDMVFLTQWYKDGSTIVNDPDWNPKDIAISPNGLIYVVSDGNTQVFDLSGSFVIEYTTGEKATGIVVDNGYFYITITPSLFSNSVYKHSRLDGSLVADWYVTDPTSIAMDASGDLYITDGNTPKVVKINNTDGTEIVQWGSEGVGQGEFALDIRGITIGSDGFVYVSDTHNNRIQKFTTDGRYVSQFGSHGFSPGEFSLPTAVKMSPDGEKIYVVDKLNHRVQRFKKGMQTTNNKAITLAGGGNQASNTLWKATKVAADLAYWVLKYQGFGTDDIQYLSSEKSNNAFSKDIKPATINELSTAINLVSADPDPPDSLTIFLTDHGGVDEGVGTFRVNEEEVLTSGQLQGMVSGLPFPVTIIVDACYSGNFAAATPDQGIVIASSGPNELAQFAGQGWLSFSTAFWLNIFSGNDIQAAFDRTATRMQRLFDQNPVLSANIATDVYIGNRIPGQDAPEQDTAGVTTSGNTATVTISGLPDKKEITRVWAVVIPPFSSVETRGKPLLDFPEIEMSQSRSNPLQWKGEYNNLDLKGVYTFMIYFMNREGNTSIPIERTASLVAGDLQRKAAIVVGGNADPGNLNWPIFKAHAEFAYQTLRLQGYDESNIDVLSPEQLFDLPWYQATPTTFSDKINLLKSGAKDLVLYMIGPGTFEGFEMNDGDKISPDELSNWLGDLDTVIIYDADFSGSFIKGLSDPFYPDRNRIIVTSTSASGQSHFLSDGEVSFSKSFWNQVSNGENVLNAYLKAFNEIQYATGYQQTPELDDNNDGFCCGPDDGKKAKEFIIGSGIQMASNNPLIAVDGAGKTIIVKEDSQSPIFQESVSATGSSIKVYAQITSPGYADPKSYIMESVPLPNIHGTSIYKGGDISDFDHYGYYNIGITALDAQGNISDIKNKIVFREDGEDIFEADDVSADSSVIFTNGSVQRHNFHDSDSQDWIKFYANADKTYEVQIDANTLEPECSPVIILYDMDGSTALATTSGTAPLSWPGTGVSINEGFYYIRVTNDDGDAAGVDTGYDISIHRTDAGDKGTVDGYIFDLNYAVVAGSLVNVTLTSSTDTTPVLSDGYYSMDIPAGTWEIKATAPGGLASPQGETVTIRENNTSGWSDFISLAVVKGDIDGDNDVDNDDANLVLDVLTGKNPAGIRSNYATSGADVNGDNVIGPEELIYILTK